MPETADCFFISKYLIAPRTCAFLSGFYQHSLLLFLILSPTHVDCKSSPGLQSARPWCHQSTYHLIRSHACAERLRFLWLDYACEKLQSKTPLQQADMSFSNQSVITIYLISYLSPHCFSSDVIGENRKINILCSLVLLETLSLWLKKTKATLKKVLKWILFQITACKRALHY